MTRITGYLLVIGLLMQAGLASGQTHDLNDNVWLSKISDKDVNYHQVVAEFEQYWSGKTPDRKSEYKFFRRWQDWAMASVHPDGTFKSPDHDLNVYEQFKMQNPGYKSSGYWEYQGPEPGPGRISALGFHPTNANTIFIGSPLGGIWKSTNGGSSWTDLNTDHLGAFGVSAIAIDPTNPDIMYIGSGDKASWSGYPRGVLKSVNGGQTWMSKNSGMGNVAVCKLLMDPNNPGVLIAATATGIFKTTDGAETWSLRYSSMTAVRDMAFKPGDPNIIYAVNENLILKSVNMGNTFNTAKTTDAHRLAIAVTPANTNRVYVIATKDEKYHRIYRSTDSGTSFQESTSTGMEGEGQGNYNLAIAADPFNEQLLYAGMV